MSSYQFKLTDILVPTRQRRTFDARALRELADDILVNGNLQQPGIWLDSPDAKPVLVWGERRYRAITLLASEGKSYKLASGEVVPLGFIVVNDFDSTADELRRLEAEFSENTVRVDLPWPDRVRALAEIHSMKKAKNPQQTVKDTAREVSAKTGIAVETLTKAVSEKALSSGKQLPVNSIPVAMLLHKHLDNPEVSKALTVNAALAIVLRQEEQRATAALIAKRKARGLLSGTLIDLHHGDARKLILSIKDKSVDLLLIDPPYGISADSINFNRMQAQKHAYSDDPTKAREFMQFLLIEGFRVARDRSNLFMFCDIKHYPWLVDAASRAAWSPFPTPIIWDKLSPGVAPWQDGGFARSYELIFFATKGRRGLSTSIRDVLQHKRVETSQRRSAAQKPDSLLRQLIAVSTIPGELILDPCAGSGSTLLAAQALKRRAVGFEIDIDLYNGALSAIHSSSVTQSAPPTGTPNAQSSI